MKRYRIYTEEIDFWKMCDVVGEYFTGYSIWKGTGVWQGNNEKMICFEIVTAEKDAMKMITEIANTIKVMNEQECVMITVEKVDMVLV